MKMTFKASSINSVPVLSIRFVDADNMPEFVAAPIWTGCCGIGITDTSRVGGTSWLAANWNIGHVPFQNLPTDVSTLILYQSLQLAISDFANMMRSDFRTGGNNRSYSNEEHVEMCKFVDAWLAYVMPKKKPITAEDIEAMGKKAFDNFFGDIMQKTASF